MRRPRQGTGVLRDLEIHVAQQFIVLSVKIQKIWLIRERDPGPNLQIRAGSGIGQKGHFLKKKTPKVLSPSI